LEVQNQPIRILRYLKPVPWLLAAIFIFSFYWDFDGRVFQLLNYEYSIEGILRIVSVSGLIGFLTNWTAITMLFRPIEKRPLLGQGLIPSHKKRIAHRLAKTVSDDLVNSEMIRKSVENSDLVKKLRETSLRSISDLSRDPEFRSKIKTWVTDYTHQYFNDPQNRMEISRKLSAEIDTRLQDKIIEKAALKIYSFIKQRDLYDLINEALLEIPDSIKKNIDDFDSYFEKLPAVLGKNTDNADELLSNLLNNLIDQLDIYTLVEENLNNYNEQKLEQMIRGATNEQLKTIQYLGAILGTIGGLVIWQPVLSLILIAIISSVIYLTDIGLSKFKSAEY